VPFAPHLIYRHGGATAEWFLTTSTLHWPPTPPGVKHTLEKLTVDVVVLSECEKIRPRLTHPAIEGRSSLSASRWMEVCGFMGAYHVHLESAEARGYLEAVSRSIANRKELCVS
jgi:hypothetical protein